MLKHRGHWIFDLDGTLTVSAHDFEHMRRELGLEPQAPILEALQAMPESEAAPLWEMPWEPKRRSSRSWASSAGRA